MNNEEMLALAERVQKAGDDIEKTWGSHPNSKAAHEAAAFIREQATLDQVQGTGTDRSQETPTPKKTTRRTKKATE